MTKKIEIATKLFSEMKDKPRADVIAAIMKKLDVSKGNASIYYAKSKDRTENPPKAKPAAAAEAKKAETTSKLKEEAKKAEAPKEKVDAKAGKSANTAARDAINDVLKDVKAKDTPEFAKK